MTDVNIASEGRNGKVVPRLFRSSVVISWDQGKEEINRALVREDDGIGEHKVFQLKRVVRPVNLFALLLNLHHSLDNHCYTGSEGQCHDTVNLLCVSLMYMSMGRSPHT